MAKKSSKVKEDSVFYAEQCDCRGLVSIAVVEMPQSIFERAIKCGLEMATDPDKFSYGTDDKETADAIWFDDLCDLPEIKYIKGKTLFGFTEAFIGGYVNRKTPNSKLIQRGVNSKKGCYADVLEEVVFAFGKTKQLAIAACEKKIAQEYGGNFDD